MSIAVPGPEGGTNSMTSPRAAIWEAVWNNACKTVYQSVGQFSRHWMSVIRSSLSGYAIACVYCPHLV
jgi:hypothetical protein